MELWRDAVGDVRAGRAALRRHVGPAVGRSGGARRTPGPSAGLPGRRLRAHVALLVGRPLAEAHLPRGSLFFSLDSVKLGTTN